MFSSNAISSTPFSSGAYPALVALGVSVAETTSANDQFSSLAVFPAFVSELSDINETVYSSIDVNSLVTEASGIQDKIFTAAEFNASFSETAGVSDAPKASASFLVLFEDSASIVEYRNTGYGFSSGSFSSGSFDSLGDYSVVAVSGDVIYASVRFLAGFSDTVYIYDQNASIPYYSVVYAESAVAADNIVTQASLNPVASESVLITDIAGSNINFVTVILEGVAGTDSPTIKLNWELVDTYEPSDWVLIDTFNQQN